MESAQPEMIYEQRAREIKLKNRRVIFIVVARRRDALSVAAEEWWRKGLRARKIGGSMLSAQGYESCGILVSAAEVRL